MEEHLKLICQKRGKNKRDGLIIGKGGWLVEAGREVDFFAEEIVQ